MNNIRHNKRGLHLAEPDKHRPYCTFFKFMSICLKMAFMRLQNHPCLLYGLDFVADKGRYFAKL